MSDLNNFRFEGEVARFDIDELLSESNQSMENASLETLLDSNLLFKGERLMDKNTEIVSTDTESNQSTDTYSSGIEITEEIDYQNAYCQISGTLNNVSASDISKEIKLRPVEYLQKTYKIKNEKVAQALIIYLSGLRDLPINSFCEKFKISKPTFYNTISKISELDRVDLFDLARNNAEMLRDFKSLLRQVNKLKNSRFDVLQIVGNMLHYTITDSLKGANDDKL